MLHSSILAHSSPKRRASSATVNPSALDWIKRQTRPRNAYSDDDDSPENYNDDHFISLDDSYINSNVDEDKYNAVKKNSKRNKKKKCRGVRAKADANVVAAANAKVSPSLTLYR